MVESYTLDELADEWLRQSGALPARTDCEIELSTGSDLRKMAREKVKRWFSRMVRSAPAALMGTADFANVATKSENFGEGSVTIAAGEGCGRALTLKLANWAAEAPVEPYSEETGRRQRNKYLRGTRTHPVAMVSADGRSITAWPGDSGEIESLTGVMNPTGERYRIDPELVEFGGPSGG